MGLKQQVKAQRGKTTRYNKKIHSLTSIQNKGIQRNNVLSSGRQLPSAKDQWTHLDQLCTIQHAHLWRCTKQLTDKEQALRDRIARIEQDHSRDRSRLSEVPSYYIYKQRLVVLFQRVDAANELMDQFKKLYKRATGHEWKPRPDVNAPLLPDHQTTKGGTKTEVRAKPSKGKPASYR